MNHNTNSHPRTRQTAASPHTRRRVLAALILCVAGITLALCSLMFGDVFVPLDAVIEALVTSDPSGAAYVVSEFRFPRAAGAVLVGIGLGAAGAITQSMLKNPLASPDIIGVTSGASTAAVLSLAASSTVISAQAGILGGFPVAFAAMAGGLLAGTLVLLGSWKRGLQPSTVVLVGLGVNAGFGALTSWVLLNTDLSGLENSLVWLTGSLNRTQLSVIVPVALLASLILIIVGLNARTLGVLRYDARIAEALGVRVNRAQIAVLALAVVLAAAVTAVAGPVPFVAFIAPQIALVLFRTEGPPAGWGALVGAVMMLGSDMVASRMFSAPLPVGIVTAVIGVPVLLWILLRAGDSPRRRGTRRSALVAGRARRGGRGGRGDTASADDALTT